MKLRRFSDQDIYDLWVWRNDEATRQNSRETALLDLATHQQWCARSLVNRARTILIAEAGDDKLGMIRFDRLNDTPCFLVSLIVAAERRGSGIGRKILTAGCATLLAQSGKARIEAEIRNANVASRRIFEACGFDQDTNRTDGDFLTYVRQMG